MHRKVPFQVIVRFMQAALRRYHHTFTRYSTFPRESFQPLPSIAYSSAAIPSYLKLFFSPALLPIPRPSLKLSRPFILTRFSISAGKFGSARESAWLWPRLPPELRGRPRVNAHKVQKAHTRLPRPVGPVVKDHPSVLTSPGYLSSHIPPKVSNNPPRRPYTTSGPEAPMAPKPRYTYNVASSFIGKGIPYDPAKHVYSYNPYHRVQRTKKSKRLRPESGHDAFFVSRVGDSGAVALGVTDGVGGWVESNVDPADFSHAFCDYMAARAYYHGAEPGERGQQQQPREALTAKQLMDKGYEDVLHDKTIQAGGSTACVGIAAPDGTLDMANLGDSGYLLLRLNGVHAYSRPQTHDFNTPFQLSAIPPALLARMATFGGRPLCDLPRDADVTHPSLQHGDVLVLATDGVWDNLFNQDILHVASRVMVESGAWQMTEGGYICVAEDLGRFTLQGESREQEAAAPGRTLQSALAVAITSAARKASVDKKILTPFGKEVRAAYPNERWDGGKVDDICVVVAVVSEDAPPIKARL